jgi:hypothetical protein
MRSGVQMMKKFCGEFIYAHAQTKASPNILYLLKICVIILNDRPSAPGGPRHPNRVFLGGYENRSSRGTHSKSIHHPSVHRITSQCSTISLHFVSHMAMLPEAIRVCLTVGCFEDFWPKNLKSKFLVDGDLRRCQSSMRYVQVCCADRSRLGLAYRFK